MWLNTSQMKSFDISSVITLAIFYTYFDQKMLEIGRVVFHTECFKRWAEHLLMSAEGHYCRYDWLWEVCCNAVWHRLPYVMLTVMLFGSSKCLSGHVLLLPPCSKVLLEKPSISQPGEKFCTSCETWGFFTMFTTAPHLSLSCARRIQATPSNPISLRPILILSFHLYWGLRSGLFHPGFLTETL